MTLKSLSAITSFFFVVKGFKMAEKNSLSCPDLDLPTEADKNSLPEVSVKKRKKKSKNYTQKQVVQVKHKDRRRVARHGFCQIVNQNKFLLVRCGMRVFRIHFLKMIFSEEEMTTLAKALETSPYCWQERDDKRGDRLTLITGTWNARGLFRAGLDPVYKAGLAGKMVEIQQNLNPLLKTLGEKITEIIKWKRPDVFNLLCKYNAMTADFGIFPLFMAPRGQCGLHNDSNDFISVIVGIRTPKKGFLLSFILFLVCEIEIFF
jgi:hypothetical protein